MAANLTPENISKVTDAEEKITGQDNPVKGGSTAQAQRHAGEQIKSNTLHDITEGEKKITNGERVRGWPTSIAQSVLSKVRKGSVAIKIPRLSAYCFSSFRSYSR
jgi:hypothetical protein